MSDDSEGSESGSEKRLCCGTGGVAQWSSWERRSESRHEGMSEGVIWDTRGRRGNVKGGKESYIRIGGTNPKVEKRIEG